MEKKNRKSLWVAICLLAAFAAWTVLVKFIDVQSIGPLGSKVGFAAINEYVHRLTGVHMALYTATDLLSVIPLGFVAGFAVLGVIQFIKRKNPLKVDRDILVLGGFYIVVMALFLFFEKCVINYRPILIEGVLEASYPSSTTMLVLCVMPTAMMQLNDRVRNLSARRALNVVLAVFTVFMVVGRLVSGVHWFTDIVGGAFLSAGLVTAYRCFSVPKNN